MMPTLGRVRTALANSRLQLGALAVVVSAQLIGGHAAMAQADSPSARDARQAIQELRRSFRTRPTWGPWVQFINLEDIECELRSGDRAQLTPIEYGAKQLRVEGHSTGPISKRLAGALEERAKELAPLPATEWAAECRRVGKEQKPVSAEQIQAARTELQTRLNGLERRLPALRRPNDPWASYLFWPETRALIQADTPDAAQLDRLEGRWEAAINAWDAPELTEASFAVRSYIRKFRAYLANESPEQHAASWDELARLLESHQQSPQSDTSAIAAAVRRRERLGEGSRLTTSIRNELSQPNIVLRARKQWLQSQFSDKIDEPFNMNEVFAGAQTVGRGTLSAQTRCDVLPSRSVGQWLFKFDGTTQARATGSSEGVTVTSHSTTQIHGAKPFTLDARGLHPKPATVTASTSVVYDNIDAPGRSRRRSEAISQTHGRRPQAESEGAASARRSVTQRMDQDGQELADKFNKTTGDQLHNRYFDTRRSPPEVRVQAGDDLVTWSCRLEGPDQFAANNAPPTFEPDADVVMSIAASALEDEALSMLGGKTLTAAQLAKTVAQMLGEPAEEGEEAQDFTAVFENHPCDVQLADGKIHVRLNICSFASAEVQYPAMTVDMEYVAQQREGQLALVRQGSVRVKPVVAPGESGISGRQQTLRLAVQRKLNKALATEFVWAGPSLSAGEAETHRLRIQKAHVDAGWLQVALAPDPKS